MVQRAEVQSQGVWWDIVGAGYASVRSTGGWARANGMSGREAAGACGAIGGAAGHGQGRGLKKEEWRWLPEPRTEAASHLGGLLGKSKGGGMEGLRKGLCR